MKPRSKQGSVTKVASVTIASQRGQAYIKRFLDSSDVEYADKAQGILKSSASTDQKVEQIKAVVIGLLDSIPDESIQIKSAEWDAPEVETNVIFRMVESFEEDARADEEFERDLHPAPPGPIASKQPNWAQKLGIIDNDPTELKGQIECPGCGHAGPEDEFRHVDAGELICPKCSRRWDESMRLE